MLSRDEQKNTKGRRELHKHFLLPSAVLVVRPRQFFMLENMQTNTMSNLLDDSFVSWSEFSSEGMKKKHIMSGSG